MTAAVGARNLFEVDAGVVHALLPSHDQRSSTARPKKDRCSARLVPCRLHALRRIGVPDQSPCCLDRKPITALLNPAGSRTGPSWLTAGRTICNAPGTHLPIASLIITYDVCVFSPRITSVGWVKFV